MFAALKRRRRVRTLVPLTVAALVAGYLVVTTLTASAATQLLSQGKTATSSSTENAGTPASSAVDGNAGTRWSSAFSDPQWIQVDLGGSATISQVVLQWEAAYATAFQIQVSSDGAAWTNVYSTTTGTGGTQTLTVSGTGRYVRMYGTGDGVRVLAVGAAGAGDRHAADDGHDDDLAAGGLPVGRLDGAGRDPREPAAEPDDDRPEDLDPARQRCVLAVHRQPDRHCLAVYPRHGFQDGPGGVGDGMGGVTQMPSAVTSAATFDPALELEYGAAIGAEFAGKGANVALGPTLNIVRDPRWGRAFETFSEDPYLTSQMTAADVRGIQSQGVMAQAKHAAVYNQETNRNGPADNAIVDTRTLQEIYLPGFQAAVTQGATASIMCGYSTVNGVYDCDHPYLLNTALYQQAGFGGFVTSDWGAAHSTVPAANSGMTMEMPGGYFYADFLRQAVANGQVSAAQLDLMVTRVLTPMFAFGLFDKPRTGSTTATVSTAAHIDVARRGAEEGTVLLKNNGILPLSTSTTHSIAVLGVDGGAGVQSVGGGSATATSSGTVWPLTGIQNRVQGTGTTVTYNDGTNVANAVALARSSDVAIVFASNNYGNEGSDQTTIDLPGAYNSLISQVAAANPRTIVVLHTNSATTMPWLDQVAGVFEGFYAGQQVGTATAALLFGDANPSGKLPVSFPKSLADVPAHTTAQWPGANNQVQYSEALKVGYRWYDSQNIAPLFPFGYGLSYTTFGFSNLQVGALNNGKATVSATVTNTGSRAGTEVVQLYVGAPAAVGEPPRSLKGFQRVALNAGASTTVNFTVTQKDLAYWNTTSNAWTTAAGTYQISIGNSSRNLPLTGNLAVTAATVPSNLLPNPYGMSSPVGKAVSWAFGAAGATYTATGLPAGLSISSAGVISGTATAAGTSTVTVTASTGASATFVWTTTP